jgi:hypothetical protein
MLINSLYTTSTVSINAAKAFEYSGKSSDEFGRELISLEFGGGGRI